MKKIIFVVILTIAVMFLAACQQQQGPSVGPTFVGGTQGITMEFVTDAPPNEVLDRAQSPFNVIVKMKNVGEWEIPSGADIRMRISGISPSEYGVSDATLVKNPPQGMLPTRRGPSGEVIEGDTLVMDFAGLNYQRDLPGDVPATFQAEACYEYGTQSSSNICVKKNLATSDTDICVVNEAKAVANSGGPVQITSIRESASANAVLLTLTIRHVGTGEFFEKGSQCSDDIQKKEKVFLKVDTGMTGLTCTGLQTAGGQPTSGAEGYLPLFGDERQITCTQPTNGQGDFTKVVLATLEYDYMQTIQKSITVKSV